MAGWISQKLRSLIGKGDLPPAETGPAQSPSTMASAFQDAPLRPDMLEHLAQQPAHTIDMLQGALPSLVRDQRTKGQEAAAERLLHFSDYLLQLRHEGDLTMMHTVEENWRARALDAMQMMLYADGEDELLATVVAYHDTLRDTRAALTVAEDLQSSEHLASLGLGPRIERLVTIARRCEHQAAEAAVASVPPPPLESAEARAALALMRDSTMKKTLMRLFEATDDEARLAYLRVRRHMLLSDLAERRLDLLWQRSLDEDIDDEVLDQLDRHRHLLYECREVGIERAIGCAARLTARGSAASPAAAARPPGAG